MKKLLEVIKKIIVWLGAVFVAIFTVLFVKEMPKQVRHDEEGLKNDDSDEINAKAAAKRDEAIARIERAESYGTVCDTITDGKERFRRRVSSGSTTGSRADN